MTGIRSLLDTGTKLWLDSIDPELIERDRALGATGATSNPLIVADLIRTGRFDATLTELLSDTRSDEELAWRMTNQLVRDAQDAFDPVWNKTQGNDGYVSFELDPLLEDPELGPSHDERVRRYVELGRHWAEGHRNRLIKVPATAAGLDALEDLAAANVKLNVTLIFTLNQYERARDAIWRGIQRRSPSDGYKSVYSIFISRLDVYTRKHHPDLAERAQGQVGIVNAKRIWRANRQFWSDKDLRLEQEIVFASTGTKLEGDPPDKYVEALAGSDIQTNPPETNEAVQRLGKTYSPRVSQMPSAQVLGEIDEKVDMGELERVLLEEGVKKFADPHRELLEVIARKRQSLATVE